MTNDLYTKEEEEAEAILKVAGLYWYYVPDIKGYWIVRGEGLNEGSGRNGAPAWIPNSLGPMSKLEVFDAFIKGDGRWYA